MSDQRSEPDPSQPSPQPEPPPEDTSWLETEQVRSPRPPVDQPAERRVE